ncbi:MAG: hypothetical protein ABI140_02030 [Jatrophihabitantaceae bacterium]
MTALLELAPLAVTESIDDLDGLFFGDDTEDLHTGQNCLVSTVCQNGSGTNVCIATQ